MVMKNKFKFVMKISLKRFAFLYNVYKLTNIGENKVDNTYSIYKQL